MSTPMCRSWCRRSSAGRPSPTTSSSCSPPCPSSPSSPGNWCRRQIFGLDGWRWVVIIGSIGAAVIWWIRRRLPESPRWLEQHGRAAEAEAIVADLENKIRADGVELAAAGKRGGRSRAQNRRLDGDVEPDLSRPHHHAGDLQSVPDHRLLRLFELGADAADFAGHRSDEVAHLHIHHRGGGAGRAAARHRSSPTASSANGRSPGPRSASPHSACCSRSRARQPASSCAGS